MALDPVFRAVLDMPGMQLATPPPEVTPAMMREMARQSMPPAEPPPIHSVSNTSVPGPAGAIPVRLYRPNATARLPLIVYFHGGGFVLCDLDSHDALCRSIANATGFAVASVAYRLAPEARFPEPLEDCYAALVALVARADEWGFDPARVAVCGDSAGGNLAAAVALVARDRKGPALRHQGLIYPVTDAACDTASMRELAAGYMLSRESMQWFWNCYLARPADAADGRASVLRVEDLSGLPPATVVTAELDPLRDEGETYADRLRAAGVPVVGRRYLGMIHGFVSMPAVTPLADRAVEDLAQDIRAALS
jgi:acetyl esterase